MFIEFKTTDNIYGGKVAFNPGKVEFFRPELQNFTLTGKTEIWMDNGKVVVDDMDYENVKKIFANL